MSLTISLSVYSLTHRQAVGYGSGFFFGEEYIDTITFGSITIPQQSIGAAEFAFGFDGVDGILGYEYYLDKLLSPLIPLQPWTSRAHQWYAHPRTFHSLDSDHPARHDLWWWTNPHSHR